MLQEAKEDGIDLEHPLNTKIFDPGFCDPSDISTLSCHQLASNNQNTNTPITVNFTGLAELLHRTKQPVPNPVSGLKVDPLHLKISLSLSFVFATSSLPRLNKNLKLLLDLADCWNKHDECCN